LQHVIGSKLQRTAEEEEFIVSMQSMADKLVERGRIEGRDEGRREGRDEGRDEGRLIEAREALRRVLTARSLVPGPADRARIEACVDLDVLHRWLEQAMTATSLADALAGGARGGARGREAVRSA
jgi:hypothetical protein